jgi:hypothetical protein
MAAIDPHKMSLEELDKLLIEKNNALDKIIADGKAELRKFRKIRDDKARTATTDQKVAAMTDEEKAQMLAKLQSIMPKASAVRAG